MNVETNSSGFSGDVERRARVLAALGDPTRLRVMDRLAEADLSPDSLADELAVAGNLLAHHLKVLEGAGLVRRIHSQHDRRRTYVQADSSALDGLLPISATLTVPRVVFVCTHNSARSVLAEALWRKASDVPTASAGTDPAKEINPRARRAANRLGLTIAPSRPRSVTDIVTPDDLLVSVCDSVNEEIGPLTNTRLHWSIPDPAAEGTDAAFTAAARDLRQRIDHLAPRVTYRRGTRRRKAHP